MQIPNPLGPEPESLADFTVKEREAPVIDWYRSPIPKSEFKALHAKSDFKGALQTGGYLGVLFATAAVAFYSAGHWAWWVTVLLTFFHGMMAGFVTNAVHELGHGTVFKTRFWNRFFCRVFAFIGWENFYYFQASHTRHHRYTLHPPEDLEVTLPIRFVSRHFLLDGVVDPQGVWIVLKNAVRVARGRFEGEWELTLYPPGDDAGRAASVRWVRTLLAGHAIIVVASLAVGLWMIPILVTLPKFYGRWLFFLCNDTQHVGLRDEVPDFRLCCRTFTMNPVLQFLYWHMNFHTEHHMYAAVPCYNLGKLHALIRTDLPPCAHGLVAVWREILQIQTRQAANPDYQHEIVLPGASG